MSGPGLSVLCVCFLGIEIWVWCGVLVEIGVVEFSGFGVWLRMCNVDQLCNWPVCKFGQWD